MAVWITRDGFLDDSVSGDRYFAELGQDAEGWRIVRLWGQNLCARGRFAGQWTGETCNSSLVANTCEPGEETVFSGTVQDDFGHGISVCVLAAASGENSTVSIRSEGEGGGTVVSCAASECEGVIGIQRYTRPRFTILTLEWMDSGSFNRIVESFDAQDLASVPKAVVTNYWVSEDMLSSGAAPIESPMRVFSEPLSMLALSNILPESIWPIRAIDK